MTNNKGECAIVNVVLKCRSDDVENGDYMVDQRYLTFRDFLGRQKEDLVTDNLVT
jgi:hypothetical protein